MRSVTSNDLELSQSRLYRYFVCPTLYEFEYVREVEPVDETTRYLDRGTALHAVIEDVCTEVREADGLSDEEIRDRALTLFDTHWEAETDVTEYPAEAVYEDDRAQAKAAIDAFFTDGDGIEHARNSVATEYEIEFEYDGATFTGYVDNVLETEDGLRLIDYKTSDIDPPFTGTNYVEEHLNEEYHPERIKAAVQASLYLRGIRDTPLASDTREQDLEFAFYGLMDSVEADRGPDGVTFTIDQRVREMSEDCRTRSDEIWALIERGIEGITSRDFTPAEVRWDDIRTETCEECSYWTICPQYLNDRGSRK